MNTRLQDQHEKLKEAVNDPEVCATYAPGIRVYGLILLNDETLLPQHRQRIGRYRIYPFDYCPWTGKLLPGDLWDARKRFLKKEYGLVPPDDPFVRDWIPKEFLETEWWIEPSIDIKRRPRSGPRSWKPMPYNVKYVDYFGIDPPNGLWRSADPPPHICEAMETVFDDIRYMIAYIPWTREYGIRRVSIDRELNYQPIRMMKIDYCPWCGTKLPESLKSRWMEEMEKVGRTPNDPNLPQKFLSDAWWRALDL